MAHSLTHIEALSSVRIKSLVNWSKKKQKKEVIVGLERINTVSLKKLVSVPRLTIWGRVAQNQLQRRKRELNGDRENFARAGFQGGLFGKTKEPKRL